MAKDNNKCASILKVHPLPENPLDDIFARQKKFGSKFCNFNGTSDKYIEKWTAEFLDCIDAEIAELRDWLPWKHWKKYDLTVVDDVEIRFEVIDILHFVVSAALVNKLFANYFIREHVKANNFKEMIVKLKGVLLQNTCVEPNSYENKVGLTAKVLRDLSYYQGQCYRHELCVYEMLELTFMLCIIWDMDAQDIYSYYVSKNEENFARQERGY